MMTAYEAIDNFCAAIRQRIIDNADTLGGVKEVLDRDEDPAIIVDNAIQLPIVCVIFNGDKADHVTFSMGSDDWEHDFEIVIVGYYRFSEDNSDPFSDLALMRKYAYDTLELFRGPEKSAIEGGNLTGADVEMGYFDTTDYVMHRYVITLKATLYEV